MGYLEWDNDNVSRKRTSKKWPKYVVVDPSPFTTNQKIISLLKTLKYIKLYSDKESDLNVILPTSLFNTLQAKDYSETMAIFDPWLRSRPPFHSRKWAYDHVNKLMKDDTYLNLLDDFFSKYNPVPATEFVRELEKIGENSIYKGDLIEKFGYRIGNTLFELLAISYKLDALIISFGETTISFFERTGEPILRAHSETKKTLKRNEHIRNPIKFIGYSLATNSLSKFIELFDINAPNIRILGTGVGLIIIGDG